MRASLLVTAIGCLCVPMLIPGPAHAQALRTWVSGLGDDVNPCVRTAPCKTFAGAISKTAPGGIINCLDPGGFGAITITKSITLDCTNVPVAGVAARDSSVDVPGCAGHLHHRFHEFQAHKLRIISIDMLSYKHQQPEQRGPRRR